MNSLISVNQKFFDINPKRLVEIIKESKYTKGLEFAISDCNEEEIKYLDGLVFEANRNDLIIQIHGNSTLSIEDQLSCLDKISKYSDILGYKIVVTLHSLNDDDKEVAINKTVNYFSEVINNIDNNKLLICMENLNDSPGLDRLEKEAITPIVLNNEKLYFTYDMGHELADFGNTTNLNEYMIEDIRNIHFHSNDNKGNDHLPIYGNDIHWNELMKCILFLVNNKYKYNIVFEYNVFACQGDSLEDKIRDYLYSIDLVSEHLNER